MTDRLDAVPTQRQDDQEQADDFAHLLHALTVGRRWAIGRYVFLLAFGATSWAWPSKALSTQATVWAAAVCSVLWVACGLVCLVSAVRDRRDGEYLGIPGIQLGLFLLSGALVWQAVKVDMVALPYAFLTAALVSSLGKRKAELKVLRRADASSSGRVQK